MGQKRVPLKVAVDANRLVKVRDSLADSPSLGFVDGRGGWKTAVRRCHRFSAKVRRLRKSDVLALSPTASAAHIRARTVWGGEGRLGNCPVDSFRPERAEPREALIESGTVLWQS
jgi:hypothetical protein